MENENTHQSSTHHNISRKNILTYTVVAAVLLAAGLATGYAIGQGLRSSQQPVSNNAATNSSAAVQIETIAENAKAINSYGDLSVGDKWVCNKDSLVGSKLDICEQMSTHLGGNEAQVSVERMVEVTSEETESNRFVLGNILYFGEEGQEVNPTEKYIYNLDVTGSAYVVHVSQLNDTTDMLPMCQYVDGLGWKDVFPKCSIDENDEVGRGTR